MNAKNSNSFFLCGAEKCNAYECPTCGNHVCADCAKAWNNVCPNCFSKLYKISLTTPRGRSDTAAARHN